MNATLFQALALIIPLIFAIVFHEVAHGYVAKLLGDTTAEERRRLTLNPLRHVDLFGTVILPGFLALIKAPVFGWAKPVPVDKWRLRNPRAGMMLVAAAGPATNLVMAWLGALALGTIWHAQGIVPGSVDQIEAALGQMPPLAAFLTVALYFFLQINIFLALFNLLPIPPFDGSHIVEGLLPLRAARTYARLRRYGFTLVFLLLIVLPSFIPGFDPVRWFVQPPVAWLTDHYLALAMRIAGR